MYRVVKVIKGPDGDSVDNYWHLVDSINGTDSTTLCTGIPLCDCDEVTYKDSGKITCPKCISIVKFFKSVKL